MAVRHVSAIAFAVLGAVGSTVPARDAGAVSPLPAGRPVVADADPRVAVAMDPSQREALRAQMRAHQVAIQAMLAALAAADWDAVAEAAGALGGPGARRAAGGGPGTGAGAGADFRARLPERWFDFARPMHAAAAAVADEARGARRADVALNALARTHGHCVACHASFRLAEP